MKFIVAIDAVDGETNYTVITPSVVEALKYLDLHDHEGSSVSLMIEADSIEVYDTLRAVLLDSMKFIAPLYDECMEEVDNNPYIRIGAEKE